MESPPLDRKNGAVYMCLPRGGIPGTPYGSDTVCEIVLPLYGLNDACQRWWRCSGEECKAGGATPSKFDGCLYFVWSDPDAKGRRKLEGVLGHHVDDFIGGGCGKNWDKLVSHLRARFPFRKWTVGEGGDFCGCRVRQCRTTKTITLSQQDFVMSMKPINIPKKVDLSAEVPSVVKQLRAIFGSGNWAANQTRIDLSAAVTLGMQEFPKPTWETAVRANNMIRRAKMDRDLAITIKPIPWDQVRLLGSSDASQKNAANHGTQGGYVISFVHDEVLNGCAGDWVPAVWKSYRLRRTVNSTLSSETQACRDCCSHMVYMANMLMEAMFHDYDLLRRKEFLFKKKFVNVIDCKSLYDHANSVTAASSGCEDKLTALETVIMKELCQSAGLTIKWGPGEVQIADGLTKDKEAPAMKLRGTVRGGRYQLADEGEVLKQNKMEKERRKLRKELNLAKQEKEKKEATKKKQMASKESPVPPAAEGSA